MATLMRSSSMESRNGAVLMWQSQEGRTNQRRCNAPVPRRCITSHSPHIPHASHSYSTPTPQIPKESVVDVTATVATADVKGATQTSVELQISKLFVISKASPILPFQLEDASR